MQNDDCQGSRLSVAGRTVPFGAALVIACLVLVTVLAGTAPAGGGPAITVGPAHSTTWPNTSVYWQTNVSATTEIDYGPTSETTPAAYPNHFTASSSAGATGTVHSVSLRYLTPGTYFYRVTSDTGGSGSVTSSEHEFVVARSSDANPIDQYVLDGTVKSIDVMNGTAYVGGSFTHATPRVGAGVATASSGQPVAGFPEIDGGAVKTVISDGNGGWFVGGGFKSVGGLARGGLAHILPDGGVDPTWNAAVENGDVDALALSPDGTNLVVGGNFNDVSGNDGSGALDTPTGRAGIAMLSIADGTLAAWNPGVTGGAVLALSSDASNLYVAGSFTNIGGSGIGELAQYNASDTITGFNANVNGPVTTIVSGGGNVYFGGSFTTVNGGTARARLASFTTAGAYNSTWTPSVTGSPTVATLAINGSTLFVGGSFSAVNGAPRANAAAIQTLPTGFATLSWTPDPDGPVASLASCGGSIYAAGSFANVNSAGTPVAASARLNGAAFNTTDGTPTAWQPNPAGAANAVACGSAGSAFIGGSFAGAGTPTSRSGGAAFDLSTGTLTAWNPDVRWTTPPTDIAINSIADDGTHLFIGGHFYYVNGATSAHYIAEVNDSNGTAITPFTGAASTNTTVNTLLYHAGTLYLGGPFNSIDGYSFPHLGAMTATGGVHISGFQPQPNGTVNALATDGTYLYVGGTFSSLVGSARTNIGAVTLWNGSNGGALRAAWKPAAGTGGDSVNALDFVGGNLYVGGSFASLTNSAGTATSINNAGEIDTTADSATIGAWTPNPNQPVTSLANYGNAIYVGGSFSTIGGASANGNAQTNGSTGTASGWSTNVTDESSAAGSVDAIAATCDLVLSGGDFAYANGLNQSGLAITPHEPASGACPAPTAPYSDDSNAQTGTTENVSIGSQTPHFSWQDALTEENVARQRVQVFSDKPAADAGVLALWHLDNNLTDDSGNGWNLNYYEGGTTDSYPSGGPWSPTYDVGQSPIFDHDLDLVANPNTEWAATQPTGAFDSLTNFTVGMWIKTSSCTALTRIMSRDGGASHDQFSMRCKGDGTPQFNSAYLDGGGLAHTFVVAGSTSVADGQWHYLVGTVSSDSSTTTITLYVDGNQIGSTSEPGPLAVANNPGCPAGGCPIVFGEDPQGGGAFTGDLDDAIVFDHVLRPAEIQAYYASGLPHGSMIWDSDPSDAGAPLGGSPESPGTRTNDVIYGSSGPPAGRLDGDGTRYWVRGKLQTSWGLGWSGWSGWDWFKTGNADDAPSAQFSSNTDASTGNHEATGIQATDPHMSWINGPTASSQAQRVQVTNGPLSDAVALWHLDGNGSDASGNGNALAISDGPIFTPGQADFGDALDTDSITDSPPTTNATMPDLSNDYTVSAWFRTANPANGAGDHFPTIIERTPNGSACATSSHCNFGIEWDVESPTDCIYADTNVAGAEITVPTATGCTDGTSLRDDKWHLATMTIDSSNTMSFYLDGNLVASKALPGPSDTGYGAVTDVGTEGGGWGSYDTLTSAFYGQIDDIAILNTAWTASEVAGYYKTHLPYATTLWDSGTAGTTLSPQCAASSRCSDAVYNSTGGATALQYSGSLYWARAAQESAGGTWSGFSDWDWFSTASPPTAPDQAFADDSDTTVANCCTENTNITNPAAHFSWINEDADTATKERTQVVTDPLDDVVALWHLNGNGSDASGNGHTLTLENGATYGAGASNFGQALSVDGSNDARPAASAAFALSTVTAEAWFEIPTSGTAEGSYANILERSAGGCSAASNCNYEIDWRGASNKICAESGSGSTYYAACSGDESALKGTGFHYVALTINASHVMNLYIDGAPAASTPMAGPPNALTPGRIAIGSRGPADGSFFTGLIDEVRISSVARSAADIAGYYATGMEHDAIMWDSSTSDTGNPLGGGGTCATATRCPDVMYGSNDAGALPLIHDGARYYARAKYHEQTSGAWSAWSTWDHFDTHVQVTVNVDSPTIAFGTALSNTDQTATTNVDVTSNNADGYSLSVSESTGGTGFSCTTPASCSTGTIAAFNAAPASWTASTPQAWAAGIGNGFALSLLQSPGGKNTATWGTGTSADDVASLKYVEPTTANAVPLFNRSSYAAGTDTATVGYRLDVPPAQATGNYSVSLTYTALANP